MIVRNEERNLSDCLEPVASLFDEIVIVDTGSNDATKDIAARFTDHVYDFPWRDDFSAARNESLRRATGDWIFWLDADDRIRPEYVTRLRDLLAGLGDRPQLHYMDTVVHHDESEAPHLLSHIRLFRRHPELQWRNRVHEYLQSDPNQWGYEAISSEVRIDHIGYQDASMRQRKLRRDLRLLRLDYAEDPDNFSTVLHLGMACAELGNFAEARKHLHRILAADDGRWMPMERVYRLLADLSLREGQASEALGILNFALARFRGHAALLYAQACLFLEMCRYDDARRALEQIISGPEGREHFAVPSDLKRKLAPCRLAEVLRLQNDFVGAERALRAVLQDFAGDAQTWYALGCVYGDTDHQASLCEVLDRLHSCPGGRVYAAALQVAGHLKRQELEAAGALIDQMIGEAPHQSLLRLLRCQWLDKVGATLEERIGARRDLLRIQPGNLEVVASLAALENAQRSASEMRAGRWFTPIVSSMALTEAHLH